MTDFSSISAKLFRFLRIAIVCQLVFVSTCRGFFQNLADMKKNNYYPPDTSCISPTSTTMTASGAGQGRSNGGSVVHRLPFASSVASATRLQDSSSSASSSAPSASSSSASAASLPNQSSRQIKPPRFVQKAHAPKTQKPQRPPGTMKSSNFGSSSGTGINNNNNNNDEKYSNRRRGPPLPPGVIRSEKSIEEMEAIMMKRWGALEQQGLGHPFSSSSPTKKSRNGNKSSSIVMGGGGGVNPFQPPIFDPWADQNDGQPPTRKKNMVREFYDEDDEGFEILELDDEEIMEGISDDAVEGKWEGKGGDTPLEARNPRLQISHLIAPKPVGGQGTTGRNQQRVGGEARPTLQRQQRQVQQPSQSYFFNPNKQPLTPLASGPTERIDLKQQRNTGQEATSAAEETSMVDNTSGKKTSRETRARAAPAKALVDEDGNPLLMTVDEALRRFQSSSPEDAVAAMTTNGNDDASPLVAYRQQYQQHRDDPFEPPSWNKIGITSDILLKSLYAMSCSAPLAVQEKAIPSILTGNDVLVGTYTGSGKTLAFLTPLIERLLWNGGGDTTNTNGDDSDVENDFDDPGLAVLIVAPGRELASQIVSVARRLCEDTPLRVQLAIGGTTFSRNYEQIRQRKPNIIVGTPGRIAELVVGKPGEKSGKLKIGNLQTLVLDEFDALLGYKPHREPTRAILQALQRRHGDALQSILCSATASDLMDSPEVTEYLRPGFATAMADEDDVFVTKSSKPSKTKQLRPQVSRTVLHGMVHVPHRRFALDTIRRILHTEPIPQQILIFVESARKVDLVVDKLAERGIIAAPLHGGQGSDKMDRADVAKALREGYVGIVVATELAARGLDAPLLTHVINLDLPTDSSHYAHRAGRCGRGGRPGVVINITTSPKERNVPKRFAESLGIEMYSVEPREGKLILVDPETQTLDD